MVTRSNCRRPPDRTVGTRGIGECNLFLRMIHSWSNQLLKLSVLASLWYKISRIGQHLLHMIFPKHKSNIAPWLDYKQPSSLTTYLNLPPNNHYFTIRKYAMKSRQFLLLISRRGTQILVMRDIILIIKKGKMREEEGGGVEPGGG